MEAIVYLVYTKTVDSVKRARWLARQTPNILHHLPPSDSGKKWRLSLRPLEVKKSSKSIICCVHYLTVLVYTKTTIHHTAHFALLHVTQDSQTEKPWASHCFCMLLSNREHLSVPWWGDGSLHPLNNFRLTSKIQTMLLASLTHSLSMNPINVLAFFSPWTSNRCILSSPTTADYRLSPIALTKGPLRNHLHTRWFAWRSWYWPSTPFHLMTNTTAKLVELPWAVEWGPITRVCLSDT